MLVAALVMGATYADSRASAVIQITLRALARVRTVI
jgi:hypothetical protein